MLPYPEGIEKPAKKIARGIYNYKLMTAPKKKIEPPSPKLPPAKKAKRVNKPVVKKAKNKGMKVVQDIKEMSVESELRENVE